jgi:hypothetical protein
LTDKRIDYFCDGKYKTGDVVICNENYVDFIAGEKYEVATKHDFEIQNKTKWIENSFEFVLRNEEEYYAATSGFFTKFIDGEKIIALYGELETAEW